MPDDLSTLLHADADAVRVPAPDPAAVLARGRALRRRRRAGTALVAAAAVLAVGTGGVLVGDLRPEPDPPPASTSDRSTAADAATLYATYGAFTVGQDVIIGGDRAVTIGRDFSYVAQTSAGAVVLTTYEATATSERRVVLVRPDGTTTDLDASIDAGSLASQPDAPYIAWVDETPEGGEVHVWDVATDQEVGGGEVPPAAEEGTLRPLELSGDALLVEGTLGGSRWLEWLTGDLLPVGEAPAEVAGRLRLADQGTDEAGRTEYAAVDQATGQVVRSVVAGSGAGAGEVSLSPDGRTLYVPGTPDGGADGSAQEAVLVDVATGTETRLDVATSPTSWTPDGGLLGLAGSTVVVCRASGCTTLLDGLDRIEEMVFMPDVETAG
ncbi:hypothetical protein QE364_003003 [Nocardioides zeae]|uniref:Uncharacterized protein n=1 Tax=Nocardioides zeae TaxID=1457234 RepID=A0ACC6ILA6_9ACTN|nr:hypothetical protein [Nocardioides zeae]MDR6175226.1 hypothetical protein [Nocardioides zeae]MDR6211282.1 hypothetical protein [Nocardioides zeae]